MRSPGRYLLLRSDDVRAADPAAAFPGDHPGCPPGQAPEGGTPADADLGADAGGRPGRLRPEDAGQEEGGALAGHEGGALRDVEMGEERHGGPGAPARPTAAPNEKVNTWSPRSCSRRRILPILR